MTRLGVPMPAKAAPKGGVGRSLHIRQPKRIDAVQHHT